MYNLTNLTGNAGDLITSTNNASGGYLIALLTVVIFIVITVALLRFGFLKGIVAASFATFMISLLFTYAKWLNPLFALAYLIILGFTGLLLYLEPD